MNLAPLPPPPPAEVRLAPIAAQADRLVASGKGEAAIHLLLPYSKEPALGVRLGRAYLLLRRYEEATSVIEVLLPKHRDLSSAYFGLAWSALGRDLYGMAYLPLEEGLRYAPGFEAGWSALGRSYYFLKRYSRAVWACDQAIARAPRDGDAWLYKGLSLAMGARPTQALPTLQRACDLLPKDPLPRRMAGRVLLRAGRAAEAEAQLKAGLALAPHDPALKALLQDAYKAQGKRFEALRDAWGH